MKAPQIAYITETSPDDKLAWSGTAHYVYEALKHNGFSVIALGPARPSFSRAILAAINQISLQLFKKRFDYRHSLMYSRAFGRIFTHKLRRINYDLVVVCGGTEYGAFIKTNKPVYYVLDRTIAGALNYHSILSDLWSFSMQQSVATDRRAMEKASGLFFSSPWAEQHARQHYHLPAQKIHVLPFGANMDQVADRQTALQKKDLKTWKILMIGSSWKNKGADIACNAVRLIRASGQDIELTIVGCNPPDYITEKYIHIIPFADKNTTEGMSLIAKLYNEHHLFILPTRFDCTPIVFCEASAFGLPILSASTGGVAGHIKENVNGYLLPYEDDGPAYAQKISEIMRSESNFEKLRASTRDHYETTLNWNTWAQSFRKIVTSSPSN